MYVVLSLISLGIILKSFQENIFWCQILSSWLGDVVDYGIGLSIISPSQGLRILPLNVVVISWQGELLSFKH